MTDFQFSNHLIDYFPQIFPYHSFLFSDHVRPIHRARPTGASYICQIWRPSFKLPMPFIYLLKRHTLVPILPFHSATTFCGFLTFITPPARKKKKSTVKMMGESWRKHSDISTFVWLQIQKTNERILFSNDEDFAGRSVWHSGHYYSTFLRLRNIQFSTRSHKYIKNRRKT